MFQGTVKNARSLGASVECHSVHPPPTGTKPLQIVERPISLGQQTAQCNPGSIHRPENVESEQLLCIAPRELPKFHPGSGDPGIVDPDVNFAKTIFCLFPQVLHLGIIGDVTGAAVDEFLVVALCRVWIQLDLQPPGCGC